MNHEYTMLYPRRAFGHIAFMALNRPERLNATNGPMLRIMSDHLQQWEADERIQAVVVFSEVDGVFCAGGDLRELYEHRAASLHDKMEFFRHEYSYNLQLHEFSKPVVTLINGIVMGGGLGISIHASHVVASEHLRLAMPECLLGFFPDIGAGYFLTRMRDHAGLYLGLSAESIGPDCALRWGLATHAVSSEHYSAICDDLLSINWSDYPHRDVDAVLAQYSSVLSNQYDAVLNDYDASVFAEVNLDVIMQRLAQCGAWGQTLLQRMQQLCPLSIKVFLEQYRRSVSLDFSDVMAQEFNLAQQFLVGQNIYEGIRAKIIDKDQQPKWQPAQLDAISDDEVCRHFDPVGDAVVPLG